MAKLKCCICSRDIQPKMGWEHGNNAQPINKRIKLIMEKHND